jgi:hypothetical protein
MATCKHIRAIDSTENIGDSILTINNNFFNLSFALCDLIERLKNKVEIRTFFYYGINTGGETPTTNMQDGVTSRPSDTTIRNFVNSSSQLNLLPSSKKNDQVYVVYQKTGFKQSKATRKVAGSIQVNVISSLQTVYWDTTTPDIYSVYSPAFIIWLLVHDGTDYKVQTGFPKFLQAETSSTLLWNQPTTWATY